MSAAAPACIHARVVTFVRVPITVRALDAQKRFGMAAAISTSASLPPAYSPPNTTGSSGAPAEAATAPAANPPITMSFVPVRCTRSSRRRSCTAQRWNAGCRYWL